MIRLAAAFLLTATALAAQQPDTSAVLAGRVVAGGVSLSGVEVSVQGLQWSVTTDSGGRFRMAGLRPGRHEIILRRIGYSPLRDTVVLAAGRETDRAYVMEPVTTQLDTVRTSAEEVQYFTPRLKEFEARRKRNVGGYFISEADLRKDENVSMPSILRRFPGLGIVQYNGSNYARTRNRGAINEAGDPPLDPRPGSPVGCWASVYLDGMLIFDVTMMNQGVVRVKPPDLGQFFAMNLSGVEYYSSAGSTPLQYKTSRSNCGVILFWTRGR